MTNNILETEETVDNTLEGTYEPAQQKTRIFTTLSALTDYVNVFKIENGQYAKGILRDSGRTVFQLSYLNEDL